MGKISLSKKRGMWSLPSITGIIGMAIGMIFAVDATAMPQPGASISPNVGMTFDVDASRHPMDIHLLDGVSPADVEQVMAMTEQQIIDCLPVQTPRIHTGCPNCHVHQEGDTWMTKGERGQLRHIWYWDFDPLKPSHIRCRLCGETYPDNPKFPEDHVETFTNPVGETYEIRSYLEKADPDSSVRDVVYHGRDRRYYMRGALDTARWYWLRQQMLNLARLYHLTKDERYAERALLIFNGYCDRFPHFLMGHAMGRDYANAGDGKRLDRRDATRSGRRGGHDGDVWHMWPVFDLLYNSQAMNDSKDRFGEDLRKKYISTVVEYCTEFGRPFSPEENEKFRRAILDAPLQGGQQSAPVPERWDLILNDTEMLRRVIRNWEIFPFHTFAVDGGYYEGLGYGSITLLGVARFRDMNGYSDPDGYEPPPGEERYENWQHPTGEYETFYRRVFEMYEALRLPDGNLVMFSDGSAHTSATFLKRDPLERAVCINRPGIGHVILGDGEGADMVQAHIGFGNASWHSHADNLGFQLWAHGHYLIDDITYPKHRLRAHYSSNQYHNTVTVDGLDQPVGMVEGDVVLYEPNLPGFSVVKVNAPRAHVGAYDVYSRQLMLVTSDPRHPYVIDVFRVKGGKVKDYMLLSSTRHNTVASYSMPLEQLPGNAPLADFNRFYDAFNHVGKGSGAEDFTVTYTIRNPEPYPPSLGSAPVGTRHHFVGDKNTTVFRTRIPTNDALFKGVYENFSDYPDQWPFTIVRHEGEESLFVVVHEPFRNEPVIHSVRRLETEAGVLALEVKLPDRTDRLLMSLSDEPVQAGVDNMTLDGKVGFITRLNDSGKTDAYLIGGTRLTDKLSGVKLSQPVGEYTGAVRRSTRTWDGEDYNAFLLEGDNLPPAGRELEGAWIRIENRGELKIVPPRWHNFRAPFTMGVTQAEAMAAAARPDRRRPDKDVEAEKQKVDFFFNRSGLETTVEIEKIIVKDGQTWLLTKRDHGLRIDAEKQFASEVFLPGRELYGEDTGFSIIRSASNQSRPMVTVTGTDLSAPRQLPVPGNEHNDEYGGLKTTKALFMNAVQVEIAMPVGRIEYAFLREGAGNADWQTYTEPLTVAKDGQLRVRCRPENGIRTPLFDAYDFKFADDVAIVDDATLEPGLIAETRLLHVAGEITPETTKPDFELPGKNAYEYYDNLYSSFHTLEYYDGEYTANVKIQPQGSIKDLIENYYAYGTYFGRKIFRGYVRVPEDGIYTFHFRRNHDGYLKINGKRLLDYHGHIGEPTAQQVQAPLRKGLNPIEFCVQLKPSTVRGWSREFELSWSGPGFERRDMVESDYYHDPAQFTRLEKEVQPLQKRDRPPDVQSEGQPLFISDEEAYRLYQERDLGGGWM